MSSQPIKAILRRALLATSILIFVLSFFEWCSTSRDSQKSYSSMAYFNEQAVALQRAGAPIDQSRSMSDFSHDSFVDFQRANVRREFWAPLAVFSLPVAVFVWLLGNWIAYGAIDPRRLLIELIRGQSIES